MSCWKNKGHIFPEEYGTVQTKERWGNFESCHVQQTDSSVKKPHTLLSYRKANLSTRF